jgi:hypothetical protein
MGAELDPPAVSWSSSSSTVHASARQASTPAQSSIRDIGSSSGIPTFVGIRRRVVGDLACLFTSCSRDRRDTSEAVAPWKGNRRRGVGTR